MGAVRLPKIPVLTIDDFVSAQGVALHAHLALSSLRQLQPA